MPSTHCPAGLAEWRPEALRPVNIDTNVVPSQEKRDKSPRLAPELESSLKRYGSYTELKRAALIIAAAQTDKRSVKKLREEFLKIDTDASGTINEQELCAALGVAELDARISVEITPSTRCRVCSMAFTGCFPRRRRRKRSSRSSTTIVVERSTTTSF